ncbi:MAG: ABC transporter permease [Nocardioides sp.]
MTRFVGTGTLVRLILRRDRRRLPIWWFAQVGLVAVSAISVQGLYDTPQARATYAATVGTSGASIAMSGPAVALDTIGGITVFEVTSTAMIGVALMALFLALRHTRTDEEAGRTELLRAGVMGRQADLLATGLVVGAACLAVGFGVTLSFLAAGLPTSGSLLYGVSVASVGLSFTGVGLVAAQVTEHARGAVGIGLAVLGVAFLLRAIGDVAENALTWASPIGWAQATNAFGDERWWPALLPLLLGVGLAVLAGWLTTQRDIGSGLVAPRPGPPAASRWLAGPVGLAARLQRTALVGWAAGMVVLGAAFGSLGEDVQGMIEGNPELEKVFTQSSGGASIVDAYFGTVLMIAALIATGFTVSSVTRLRSEETSLRVEPLLATPLGRVRWASSSLVTTLLGTVVVLAATGLGTGLAYAAVARDAGQVWFLTGATLAYLPAALVLGAVGVALFGWAPRAGGLVWAALAVCVVIGWLGEVLQLPDAVVRLSPYDRTPQVPLTGLDWTPLLVLTAVAVALTAAGFAGLRRRDLATG